METLIKKSHYDRQFEYFALSKRYREFVVLILLGFSVSILAQDKQPKSQRWSENLELQWQDFNGQPESHIDAVAITASGITFGYSVTKSNAEIVETHFTIEAHFYPDHSWYKKTRVNSVVLNHERFHFNITELFARKFRQRIAKTKFTNEVQQEADAIYKSINEELKVMQNKYDAETNYSMDIEKQMAWQRKIQVELKALTNYKLN